MVTMNPTQAGQSGVVGTKSVHPGPSEDLQGPKRGLWGHNKPLIAGFLTLGGPTWAITVLNEPGIPLRRSGHPTSLYLKQKNFLKNWAVEIKGLGPNSPFWVPGDPLGA